MSFGRLERTPGPTPMSEINMTPLIDVMLVLVVIFIVTAPLLVNTIQIDIPKAQSSQSGPVPALVTLTIDKKGVVFINDAAQSMQTLADSLKQAAQNNLATEVQLRADTAVPYGRVVEVMGLVQKAGLTRIGFVADPPHP